MIGNDGGLKIHGVSGQLHAVVHVVVLGSPKPLIVGTGFFKYTEVTELIRKSIYDSGFTGIPEGSSAATEPGGVKGADDGFLY